MSSCQCSDQQGWSVLTVSWAGARMWLKNNLEDPWWMLMEGGTHPASTNFLGSAAWQMGKDDEFVFLEPQSSPWKVQAEGWVSAGQNALPKGFCVPHRAPSPGAERSQSCTGSRGSR